MNSFNIYIASDCPLLLDLTEIEILMHGFFIFQVLVLVIRQHDGNRAGRPYWPHRPGPATMGHQQLQ